MTKSVFRKDYWRKRTRTKIAPYSRDYDKEGILRQPFGYCAVQVEVIQSKGTDDEKKSYTASYHSKDRVQQLLTHLQLPYELNANITSLPKATLRRYLIDSFIFSLCSQSRLLE